MVAPCCGQIRCLTTSSGDLSQSRKLRRPAYPGFSFADLPGAASRGAHMCGPDCRLTCATAFWRSRAMCLRDLRSGLTAAWIYELLDRPPDSVAVEATAPRGVVVCDRADLRFLRCELAAGDVVEPLRQYGARRPGWRGVSQARCVIDLSEPATESPMESQLRLLMVRGGLPRPEPQVSIYDRHGVVVARLDLFYRAANLGLEYDGSAHRDSLAADARRLNRLLRAGVSVLRYTAGDVYNRPHEVVEELRAELAARKHPAFVC
jgi:hypothetical protein